jgi:hypothetical protein
MDKDSYECWVVIHDVGLTQKITFRLYTFRIENFAMAGRIKRRYKPEKSRFFICDFQTYLERSTRSTL